MPRKSNAKITTTPPSQWPVSQSSEPCPAVAEVDPGLSSPLVAGLTSKQTQTQTQDCAGMWIRVDLNHKGVLDSKQLDKFRSVLNTVDTNKGGKISQSEFMTACQKGELKNIQL